jgi:hypothetical protein
VTSTLHGVHVLLQVGGFFFIHRDDLKHISPLWLKYTEDVRADPEVCRPVGSTAAHCTGRFLLSFTGVGAGLWL